MKDIAFIDGKTTVRIKDDRLEAYLEGIEAAGYMVRANKCKTGEWSGDILMIGKAGDFDEFFSGKARIKEIAKQSSEIYRLLFDDREMVLYLLDKDC